MVFHFILILQPSACLFQLTPWGLGKLVEWISETYGKIPIIITENGVSEDGTSLQDDIRIEQIQVSRNSNSMKNTNTGCTRQALHRI